MNNDLISKAELFNKLAVIKAPPEANEYKGEVYSIIQAMETADVVSREEYNILQHNYNILYDRTNKLCDDMIERFATLNNRRK